MDKRFWLLGNAKGEQTSFLEIKKFCEDLLNFRSKNIVIGYAPPREALLYAENILKNNSSIMLGSQTIGEKAKGTFTGMPMAALMKEIGVGFALINHIEAKSFGWGGKDIISQINLAIKYNMAPILIVGEPVSSNKFNRDQRIDFLKNDLMALTRFGEEYLLKGGLSIAYESGFIPRLDAPLDVDYALEGFILIREILRGLGFEILAEEGRKIFGVGVSLETLPQVLGLIKQMKLNGLLVGKSSVDSSEFLAIAEALDNEFGGRTEELFSETKSTAEEKDFSIQIPAIPVLNKKTTVGIFGYGEIGAAIPAVLSKKDLISVEVLINNNLSPQDAAGRTYKSRFLSKNQVKIEGSAIILSHSKQKMEVISIDSGVTGVETVAEIMPLVQILIFTAGNLMKKAEFLDPFFKRGVQHIILTSNSPIADISIIPGFNHHLFNPKIHKIIALGSCTSNWGIPIIAIIEEILGKGAIGSVVVTGAHSKTNSQQIGDRGASAKDEGILNNLILTSTGIKDLINNPDFFPGVEVEANMVRTPVEHSSLGTMVLELADDIKINFGVFKEKFKKITFTPRWQNIVEWEEFPDGSKNYWKSEAGSVVFAPSIKKVGRMIIVSGAYANVYGYACQIKRLIQVIGSALV